MLSMPYSPSKTPSKNSLRSMAVERGGLTSTIEEQPSGDVSKQVAEPPRDRVARSPGEEIQVPSTAPQSMNSATKSQKLDTSQKRREKEDDETSTESADTRLPSFDWQSLHNQFALEMNKLSINENSLLDEFDRLHEAFSAWAVAGGDRGTERAVKRMKTRGRYVELQEDALEQKHQHYTQVVGAFKVALEMLTKM